MFGISLFLSRWDGRTHLLLPVLIFDLAFVRLLVGYIQSIDGSCLGGLWFESGSSEKKDIRFCFVSYSIFYSFMMWMNINCEEPICFH